MCWTAILGLVLTAIFLVAGADHLSVFAEETASPTRQEADAETCADCHQDQERLQELSQRWPRVYVDAAEYAAQAQHSTVACTTCHGGNPQSDDPEEACIGIAYKNPSAPEVMAQTCGASNCHTDISARFATSLHSTMDGHKLALQDLLGDDVGLARYEESCNNCHTTCADCHMEEPGAHGLLYPRVASHRFQSLPSADNCWSCHGGTGDTFFGEPGSEDVHGPSMMAEAGMVCTDCHGEAEIHGDGTRYPFLVFSPGPHCEDCHTDSGHLVTVGNDLRIAPQYADTNPAHEIHDLEAVSCEGCHTEWYANCWNCHEGRTGKVTYDFQLAVNPLTDQIYPAAHSPAGGEDWGNVIPAEIGGGWAIKARHSWGEPHECTTCHANPAVFIQGVDREAPFVGYWTETRGDAQYVSQERAALLTIDVEALAAGVHAEQNCDDCHAVQDSTQCDDCHTTVVDKPADADWSRTPYMAVRGALDQAEARAHVAVEYGIELGAWETEWDDLRTRYLSIGNSFHSDPVAAQMEMTALAEEAQRRINSLNAQIVERENRTRQLTMALPFGIGLLGALIAGVVIIRPIRKSRKG
ncbi:MAG: hypothetical protein KDD84_14435 [Caldilineaceae bacterium]|nr:hypothetical protein [Caldilineaceae bacterium]